MCGGENPATCPVCLGEGVTPLTPEQFAEIRARLETAQTVAAEVARRAAGEHAAMVAAFATVPALLAEVERLTALLDSRARFAEQAERRHEYVAKIAHSKIKEAEGRREYGDRLARRVSELEQQVAAVRAFATGHEYRWLHELLDGPGTHGGAL